MEDDSIFPMDYLCHFLVYIHKQLAYFPFYHLQTLHVICTSVSIQFFFSNLLLVLSFFPIFYWFLRFFIITFLAMFETLPQIQFKILINAIQLSAIQPTNVPSLYYNSLHHNNFKQLTFVIK